MLQEKEFDLKLKLVLLPAIFIDPPPPNPSGAQLLKKMLFKNQIEDFPEKQTARESLKLFPFEKVVEKPGNLPIHHEADCCVDT